MKKSVILFFLLISSIAFGQKKKTYYLNEENDKISKSEYRQLNDKNLIFQEAKNDTANFKVASLKKYVAKLDSLQLKQVQSYLKKLIGSDFDSTKKTMIHLYRKNGKKINEDASYNKYWSWIKTNSKKYQAFLIGNQYSAVNENKENHILYDSENFFETIFFNKSVFEINHILIKPSGDIYVFYGRDDILYVLDSAVD